MRDRGELENGAKLKTGEREIFVSQHLMDLYDDYLYEIIDELDIETNFVFIKLRGRNMGRPMNYSDVESLFKRLRKKTKLIFILTCYDIHMPPYTTKRQRTSNKYKRLGHAQIQTTMNLYLHPSDEDIRKDWEKHNMHLKSMKKLKVVNMKRKRQINIGEVNFHERLKYELSSYIEKQSNLMDLLPLTVWTIPIFNE